MAKDFDLQLELDTKKVAQPQSFDLGIELEDKKNYGSLFPAKQMVQRSTFNLRNDAPPPTQRSIINKDKNRGTAISQGTSTKLSPLRRAVKALPGESGFERILDKGLQRTGEAVSFLFPSEQSYYREATDELGKNATTEEVIKRGRELMVKDGLLPPQEIGGATLSPLDSTPTVGRIGAYTKLGAGFKRAVRLLSKRFVNETDEKVVEATLREIFPTIDDETARAVSRRAARSSDPEVITDIINEAGRRIDTSSVSNAPRRFTPQNLPDVGADETLAIFRATDGDTQYIFNNLDDAKRYFDGDLSNVEIGVVPKRLVRSVTDSPTGDRAGVGIIPRNIADDVVGINRILNERLLDEEALARYIEENVLPFSPATPEAVLGRTPAPTQTIRRREDLLLRDKLQQAQTISRRAAVATRRDVKDIQNDLVELVSDLPLQERGKFIATIKNIQTPAQLQRALPNIQERVTTALEKVAEQQQRRELRNQVRQLINQKQLKNTESLRKSLKLPSLNQMTVEDLRNFARNLAQFEPGDRFLSQRVLETIDRTPLKDMKTYREVQQKLAKEAGVPIEDLQKIQVSWMDKFRYDTALARQNPFYDVTVRKINGSIVQGNIRFAAFEDELDDLLRAARKSRKRSVGEKLVPTDERVFKYIESPNKADLADDLTPEEMRVANFLIDRYAEARDYLLKENVLNKYVEDYITHIRRSGLEAYRQDGLISAIKESFEQYRVDQATFNVLNEKTGEVLPLEKFFAFAQKRTGGLTPTQNIGRASKAYFQAFERKRALDSVVPELQAYAQAVTPPMRTAKGLDWDPKIKTFLKTYINNKRGRPATVLFNPGSAPDVVMRGITSSTRLIDLGLSIPNFAAANVGEQAASFIAQGTVKYSTGVRRMNTKQGKAILEKYRGFVGRSPWKEIRDTSKNFPDKLMTTLLSGFHDASVRANKQGLLAHLTPEEFKSGVISPERLAAIRNEMGRWRALDNSASIIGSTSEGKIFTQYKAWAVPILSSTVDNLKTFIRTTSRGENPFKTQAGQELLRETVVVGSVALFINSYLQEEDDSFIGQMISKSTRDALSAVGALNPEMWLQTPRAWQYIQDIEAALRSLVMLEEYKSGEKAGTLKGDDALLRLITPAPVRQARSAAEVVTETEEAETDLDLGDLDIDSGLDLNLDLDLDL